MNDIFVMNVFEALGTMADGTTKFLGCLTNTGVARTANKEDIRCGVNGDLKTILQLSSDMTITLTTANWNDQFLEMGSGSEFELAQTTTVKTYELVPFTTSTADAVATITGTPEGGTVEVQDGQGRMYAATFATGTVTVTGGATTIAGTDCYVIYTKEITANVLDLRSDVLPKAFELTLHAIAFDKEGGTRVADLYFKLPKVQPEGDLNLATATNTNTTNEITLRVLPVSGSFGGYLVEEAV